MLAAATADMTMPERFTKRTTQKVMFANCGHGSIRRLEDCARLGFISAGHGKVDGVRPFFFSNQIRNLILNDIIAVYRNGVGYVGIARVSSKPMTITNAYLNGQKVEPNTFSYGNMFSDANDPGYAECLVEIIWLTKVHLGGMPGSGVCYGIFAKPSVVCSLDNQALLKKNLQIIFNLDFEQLLNH